MEFEIPNVTMLARAPIGKRQNGVHELSTEAGRVAVGATASPRSR
jgi:hypothetical protein